MHIYVYDSFLANKKYDSIVAKIETRITDLGLNGKIIRLSMLQSLHDSIKDEIKKGAKTIVAVGDNRLLHQCINAVMSFYSSSIDLPIVPVGFIPIGSKNTDLAERLGIPSGINACNILSARRIEQLDLGMVNSSLFLSEATIQTTGTSIKVDNSYSIEINEAGEIGIVNMAHSFLLPNDYQSSAKDGHLDFCIKTKKTNKLLSIGNKESTNSVFSFTELIIKNSQKQNILLDSVEEVTTPATITIAKKKLNLIVGKGTNF